MTLDDWLAWLQTLSPREIVLGLERVEQVLERLAIRRPGLVVTVAGTNGKGSSVAMLESIFRRDGARTGCYTSPHVSRYNERMRVDGSPLRDDEVMRALETVESLRQDVPLTFFEFGTLAALQAFDAAGADTWILEVGMGGRLDAVNAVAPDASLITGIGLDHCAWLGDDLESIAREKAGIMRAGVPTVFGSPEMPAAIEATAAATGATLLAAGRDFRFRPSADGQTWCWESGRHALRSLARPSLAGDTQVQNAAAVLALVEAIGRDDLLNEPFLNAALTDVHLAGRFQLIERSQRWILDVAHNPDAGRVLDGLLRQHRKGGRLTTIIGMLEDKDVEGFVSTFGGQVDAWIAVGIEGSRGGAATPLAQKIANATGKACLIAESMDAALAGAAQRSAEDDTILVTGSFYIVGPALDWLSGQVA